MSSELKLAITWISSQSVNFLSIEKLSSYLVHLIPLAPGSCSFLKPGPTRSSCLVTVFIQTWWTNNKASGLMRRQPSGIAEDCKAAKCARFWRYEVLFKSARSLTRLCLKIQDNQFSEIMILKALRSWLVHENLSRCVYPVWNQFSVH